MHSDFKEEMSTRMKALEYATQSTKTVSSDSMPKKFAEIVKEVVMQC